MLFSRPRHPMGGCGPLARRTLFLRRAKPARPRSSARLLGHLGQRAGAVSSRSHWAPGATVVYRQNRPHAGVAERSSPARPAGDPTFDLVTSSHLPTTFPTLLTGTGEPFVWLAHPGASGVAFKLLPLVASTDWPPDAPRRLGCQLGIATRSLRRESTATSSVGRHQHTAPYGGTMTAIWAGMDAGQDPPPLCRDR